MLPWVTNIFHRAAASGSLWRHTGSIHLQTPGGGSLAHRSGHGYLYRFALIQNDPLQLAPVRSPPTSAHLCTGRPCASTCTISPFSSLLQHRLGSHPPHTGQKRQCAEIQRAVAPSILNKNPHLDSCRVFSFRRWQHQKASYHNLSSENGITHPRHCCQRAGADNRWIIYLSPALYTFMACSAG